MADSAVTANGQAKDPRQAFAAQETLLWSAWQESRSAGNRHALVEHYSGWTRMVARDVFHRVRVHGVEWADYVHYATIGLLECIDRFDPKHRASFQTYARHRMRGAILNNIGRFSEASGGLGSANRYAHRVSSLSDGSTGNGLTDLIDVSVGLAIGYLLELGTLCEVGQQDSEAYRQAEAEQLEQTLLLQVEQLPENEQAIIRGHYFQQLSFVKIAELLELSKGRISQLHREAIARIRRGLERNGDYREFL